MKRRAVAPLVLTAVLLAGISAHAQELAGVETQGSQITFKSAVEVVTVNAAVRDARGRVIRDLKRADFEVVDAGARREIRDFYSGDAPISLAVLLDISGSMAVGGNMARARHAISVAMSSLRNGSDEAALFTFDATLQEVVPFTRELDRVRRVSLEGKPWGMTSLYDAIAAAAKTVEGRGNHHKALLVVTDGVDTGSVMSAPEVSGIASAIDVPVYLLTVVNPADHPGGEFAVIETDGAKARVGTLADLARWTGGDMRVASEPEHTVKAVLELFEELRYQYLITFEPGVSAGWHPLEIRTRKKNLVVRARSGYISGAAQASN